MTAVQVKNSKIFSPGLIGGEIVYFLFAEKDLFYMKHVQDGPYVKDDKGKYSKIHMNDVIEARLLYWAAYGEKEKALAVKEETETLGKELCEKSQKVIDRISELERFATKQYLPMEGGLMDMVSPTYKEEKEKQAVLFFANHPGALEFAEKLRHFIKMKNYEELYRHCIEPGEPVATFSNAKDADFTAMINIFGAANIEKTTIALKEKGSLHLMATAIIEKRYHPEK